MHHARSFEAALAQALSSRDIEVEPEFLRWLYKTLEYEPSAADQNRLGIVGFQGEFPSQEDLSSFMNIFFSQAQAATLTVVQANGGVPNPSLQTNTDVQYAAAMAFPTPLVVSASAAACIGGPGFSSPCPWRRVPRDVQQHTRRTEHPGNNELDLPLRGMWSLCQLFAQLGDLVASGDFGVGKGNCEDGEGNPVQNRVSMVSQVTGVGGGEGLQPEVAVGFSGDGFSERFPRPRYQDNAVIDFLRAFDGDLSALAAVT